MIQGRTVRSGKRHDHASRLSRPQPDALRPGTDGPVSAQKQLGRNALWIVLGQGAGQGLSLLVFLFIARYVSQSSFGLIAVSITVVEFVRRLLIDSVTIAVYSNPDVADEDYDVCFTIVAITGSMTTAAMVLLAQPVADLIGSPEAGAALRMIALLLLGYGLSGTPAAWLSRRMEFRALAVRSTLSVVFGGVVGLSMAMNGYDLWSLVGQQFTIAVVNVATLWISAGWRPRLVRSWTRVRGILRRARHVSLGALWTAIANDSDLIFVSGYFGPAVTGLYNAAKRIMLAANLMLVNSVSTLTLPALANLETDDQRRLAFRSGMMLTSALCAPAFAGLAIVSPELIRVMLGPSWHASAAILTALAASGYFLSLSQFSSSVLVVAQRAHIDSLCSAVLAVTNVCVYLIAVAFGPVALAAAFSCTTMLLFPLRLGLALREVGLGWRTMLAALLPSQAATVVMIVLLSAIHALLPEELPALAGLALTVVGGIVIYAVALRICAPKLFGQIVQIATAVVGRERIRGDIALARGGGDA